MSWINRVYNWVTDRNNGVPITASRMDAEFDNIISGMNTLHSAFDTVDWVVETNLVAFVAATQFKITGVNLVSTYHVGRRLKIVHNTGGTTVYATITAVAFVTDTTVTVATDDASSLVSTVTAVSYGALSYVSPSYLDPRTVMSAYLSAGQAYLAASGQVIIQFDTALYDTNQEFDPATFKFTAKHPGYYLIDVIVRCVPVGVNAIITIKKNTTVMYQFLNASLSLAQDVIGIPVLLVKGDTISAYYEGSNTGLNGGATTGCRLTISRIP